MDVDEMRREIETLARERFGHAHLRDEQARAILAVLSGRDALVVLPTGSGKSLCYQLAALWLHERGRGLTLVVSPLIALMQDQVDALHRRHLPAAFVNATLSAGERQARLDAARAGHLALLYVTPERFRKPEFQQFLAEAPVALLAVDEAHCISQWGHDFRPDYRQMGRYRALLRQPCPALALTATATPAVAADIEAQLGLHEPERVRGPVVRPNLRLQVLECVGVEAKADHLARLVQGMGGAALAYTALIVRGGELQLALRARGVDLPFYNADLAPGPRRQLTRRFLRDPEPALLATNAFGMGVDRPDVRLVVHCELPGSIEAWTQEIGRAGRDGEPALCVTLLDHDDLAIQQQHVRNAWPDPSLYAAVWQAIADLGGNTAGWSEGRLRERFAGRDRRDRRVDTVLRQFEALGVTAGSLQRGDLRVVEPVPEAYLDPALTDARRHDALRRLHALWHLLATPGCLWRGVADWFGESPAADWTCGHCGGELAEPELLADLPPRGQPLPRPEAPPPRPPAPPGPEGLRPGDFVRVDGARLAEVLRVQRGGVTALRLRMLDNLREERLLLTPDGPRVERVG